MLNLYEEYETRQSAESKVVKEMDRFDVMLQAFQYERSEWNRAKRVIRFNEFFEYASAKVHHSKLQPMVAHVIEERDRFWKEIIANNENNGIDINGTNHRD